MRSLIAGCGLVLSVGCGSVEDTPADGPAPQADVMPPDALPTRTAIAMDNINAFSAPTGVLTKVAYAMPAYDDRGEYDLSQSRFTATHAGDYEVCAAIDAMSPSAEVALVIFKNGNQETALADGTAAARGCKTIRLAASDTLEVWVRQTSGGTVLFTANPYWHWLTIQEQPLHVSVSGIGAYTAGGGSYTHVPYSTVVIDDRHEFDASAGYFNASQAGDYQLCASLDAEGVRGYLYPFINGVASNPGQTGPGLAQSDTSSPPGFGACTMLRLAAADVVDLRFYHSGADGNVVLTSNPPWDWLTMQQVSSDVYVESIGSFAVTNTTFTRVPYAVVVYDAQHGYDAGTGVFTAPEAGDYHVCASLRSPVPFELDVFIGGKREKALTYAGVGGAACRVLRLKSGDTVDLRVYQDSGSTATFSDDPRWDWLTIRRI